MGERHAVRWRLSRAVVTPARARRRRACAAPASRRGSVPGGPVVIAAGDVVGARRPARAARRARVPARAPRRAPRRVRGARRHRRRVGVDGGRRRCASTCSATRWSDCAPLIRATSAWPRDVDSVWLFTCRELVLDAAGSRPRGAARRRRAVGPRVVRAARRRRAVRRHGGVAPVARARRRRSPRRSASADLVVLVEPHRTEDRADRAARRGVLAARGARRHLGRPERTATAARPARRGPRRSARRVRSGSPRCPRARRPRSPGSPRPSRCAATPHGSPRCSRRCRAGTTSVVCATSPSAATHLVDQLAREGVTATLAAGVVAGALSVVVAPLSIGFAAPRGRVVVWADADVTGRRATHRPPKPRSRAVEGFFDDLVVGSFVVHRHHGVARFAGVTTREIAGTTRDYLILEYRGTDRLFLPTDQIDAITPVLGRRDADAVEDGRCGVAAHHGPRPCGCRRDRRGARRAVPGAGRRPPATRSRPDTPWQREMEALFAFTETVDQLAAINDVKADMEAPRPMDRLVCADVGLRQDRGRHPRRLQVRAGLQAGRGARARRRCSRASTSRRSPTASRATRCASSC